MAPLGKFLVVAGVILVILGLVLLFAGKVPWIGRLPGDITIRRGNFTIYLPLGTCLLISVVGSLIFWLLRK